MAAQLSLIKFGTTQDRFTIPNAARMASVAK